MDQTLSKLLEIPPNYTPSDESIWTDAHISKELLKAHLDPDFEGASRKHSSIQKSVSWIKGALPPCEYPHLLDLGCGPGLYAEAFCSVGYQVTAMDFSARSIEYAENSAGEKGLTIHYLHQDYLTLDYHNAFPLATLIYCDYGALSDGNRSRLLKNIYRSLTSGGKLLLDVFSMAQYAEFQESKTWESCPEGGFWSPDSYLALHESRIISPHLTLRQTVILSATGLRRFCLWDTYFTKTRLILEAQAAGFRLCSLFSDVTGAPYREESPTMAILLEK